MKVQIQKLFITIGLVFLCSMVITSCDNDENEGRKVTDYQECIMTVASKKLPGVVTSYGNSVYGAIYAVKKENSSEWEELAGINKFDYVEGYEYRIRVGETHYLDYDMGEPAWTEYELIEVLSKERKDSENLPPHFIPEWYFEQNCSYIEPEFEYAVDADKKEEIENDLKSDAVYKFNGNRYYMTDTYSNGDWFLLDQNMKTLEQGIVISRSVNDWPQAYKRLMPDDKYSSGLLRHYDFVKGSKPNDIVMEYDVLILKSDAQRIIDMWLFKDLTESYQTKFPDAGVRAVAIRYEIRQNNIKK